MVIDVLGLGETLSTYQSRGNITIGVNDIFAKRPADFIVIADPPARFTPQRRQVIAGSHCQAVVSHYRDWQPLVRNFRYIRLSSHRSTLKDLHGSYAFPFSNNSPFIACVLAYRLGAKRIHMYGVDMANHPSLGRDNMLRQAKADFKALYLELAHKGVMLCACEGSALNDTLPLVQQAL